MLLLLKLNKISVAIGRYRKLKAENAASPTAVFQKSKEVRRADFTMAFFPRADYPRLTLPVRSNRSESEITARTTKSRTTEMADPNGQFMANPNWDVTTFAIMFE